MLPSHRPRLSKYRRSTTPTSLQVKVWLNSPHEIGRAGCPRPMQGTAHLQSQAQDALGYRRMREQSTTWQNHSTVHRVDLSNKRPKSRLERTVDFALIQRVLWFLHHQRSA